MNKEQGGADGSHDQQESAQDLSDSAEEKTLSPDRPSAKAVPEKRREAKITSKENEKSPKRNSSVRGAVGESLTSLSSEDDLKALRMRKKSSAADLLDPSPESVSVLPSQPHVKKSLRASPAAQAQVPSSYRGPVPIAGVKPAAAVEDDMEVSVDIPRNRAPRSSLLVPRSSAIRGDVENEDKPKVAAKSTQQKVISPMPASSGDKVSNSVPIRAQAANPLQRESFVRQSFERMSVTDDFVEDMPIRVVVRKRPISTIETNRGDRDVMDIHPGGVVLLHEPKVKVDLSKVVESHEFIFDDAFQATDSNEVIYNRTVKGLVSSIFSGGKATCFAYGQTGSGKTFTMMGSSPGNPSATSKNAGLYVLAARDIFIHLEKQPNRNLKVFCSCFEIYSGKLFDLLNDRSIIKCLEDSKQQVHLAGLSEHEVLNQQELLDLMSKAHNFRSVGSTGANLESSRSHQVLQIVVRAGSAANPVMNDAKARRPGGVVGRPSVAASSAFAKSISGKLSFIDLAGSERGADVTDSSKQTRLEGAEINTSLLALKEVIRSLVYRKTNPTGHTPFRGSKLTQVLKDSFVGDNTRTCMVACVSPSQFNCEHTLNTLRYADRVKEHAQSTPSVPAAGGAAVPVPRQMEDDLPSSPSRLGRQSSGSSVSYESKDDDSYVRRNSAARASMADSTPPRPSSAPLRDSIQRQSLDNGADMNDSPSVAEESPSKSLLATNERMKLAYIKQKSGIAASRRVSGNSSLSAIAASKREEEEEMATCQRDSVNFKPSPQRAKEEPIESLSDSSKMIQQTMNMIGAHRSGITDMVEVLYFLSRFFLISACRCM